jgi:phosphatidylcholine synthase
MTSSDMEKQPNLLRSIAAWGVHLFTATGAVWGLLSILAILDGNYKMMLVWIIIAMLVDGFDGTLARLVDVKTYAKGLDGALLDNILDYINYVLVSAFLLLKADLLPESVRLFSACSILLTSAYQFTQTDAKTDDHHFKGFPSYWNIVVLYMFLFNTPPWINFGVLMFLNVMVFVPIKYIYPSRNSYLRKLTLGLTYLYAAISILALLMYPHTPLWILWVSLAYLVYYVVLSLLPKNKAHAN